MTIYISDAPAPLPLVKQAMRLLKYSDFELLAEAIEFSRSKGQQRSQAKVTAKVLADAVKIVDVLATPTNTNGE